MKTLNINKTITTMLVLATISFSSVLRAEEMALPIISKPAILEEGTQRELSKAQVAELLPWAKNSKLFLNDLLDNIQGLSTADKIDRLADGIRETVGESSAKHSELLMRYSLNRGLVLSEILSKEMDGDAVGSQDVKLRVLKASVELALKYYETDLAALSSKSIAPYVIFGLDYYNFLNELNKSVFDASAQYAIQRTSLEWLQWDMYRDLNNASYAPQIVKINNGLKTFPTKKLTDAQSIAYIRQMKALAGQLKVGETLRKLQLDKEMSQARTEADKRAVLDRREAEARRIKDEADRIESLRILEAYNGGKLLPSQSLSSGDTVIHGSTTRTVSNMTDDNQVILSYVAYSYTQTIAKRNDVEKAMTSYLGLKQGDAVLHGNTVRNVQYIGEKGTVVLSSVSYSYSTTYVNISGISKAVQSSGKYSVGDKVLYKGNIRTIQYLDNNGRLVLSSVSYSYNTDYATASEVSKVY